MKTKEMTITVAAEEYCDLVTEHRTTPLTIDDIKEAFISGAGFQRLESLITGFGGKIEMTVDGETKDKKYTDFGDA
jgi:hypothetical protein